MTFVIEAGTRFVGLLCCHCDQPFKVGDRTKIVPLPRTPDGNACAGEVHVQCPRKEQPAS